jgi:outer membrane protein assembly factor BamB
LKRQQRIWGERARPASVLFFGGWEGYFYAADATTGKEKWRFHAGEDPVIHNQVGFHSSPTVANGVVYTGCRDANLYALDAATGKEKWRFNTELSWVITSPAIARWQGVFRSIRLKFVSRG